jgi:hypothetical protein
MDRQRTTMTELPPFYVCGAQGALTVHRVERDYRQRCKKETDKTVFIFRGTTILGTSWT